MTDSGAEFDVDGQYIARREALTAKRQALGPKAELGGVGKSTLQQQLFGSWEKGMVLYHDEA